MFMVCLTPNALKIRYAQVCWVLLSYGEPLKSCESPRPLPRSFEFFAELIKRRCFEAHLEVNVVHNRKLSVVVCKVDPADPKQRYNLTDLYSGTRVSLADCRHGRLRKLPLGTPPSEVPEWFVQEQQYLLAKINSCVSAILSVASCDPESFRSTSSEISSIDNYGSVPLSRGELSKSGSSNQLWER